MSRSSGRGSYIETDNYGQEFNRKFFKKRALGPAGFLETEMVAGDADRGLSSGFADMQRARQQ